ncbi:hypothetical protein [Bradyrhizobium sp. LB13.1]
MVDLAEAIWPRERSIHTLAGKLYCQPCLSEYGKKAATSFDRFIDARCAATDGTGSSKEKRRRKVKRILIDATDRLRYQEVERLFTRSLPKTGDVKAWIMPQQIDRNDGMLEYDCVPEGLVDQLRKSGLVVHEL